MNKIERKSTSYSEIATMLDWKFYKKGGGFDMVCHS